MGWTGVVYHGLYFSTINPAATVFAALFVIQALVLAWWGVRGAPVFRFAPGARPTAGVSLLLYVVLIYPLLGFFAGMRYPAMPMFGIAPCPLVLFTFGILLLATPRVPGYVLAIPLAWSLVGGSAAFLLHVPQDWVLLLSGFVVAGFGIAGRRTPARAARA